jgi:hypothetical protein
MEQAEQSRVECPLFNEQGAAGDLLDAEKDAVAVGGSRGRRL